MRTARKCYTMSLAAVQQRTSNPANTTPLFTTTENTTENTTPLFTTELAGGGVSLQRHLKSEKHYSTPCSTSMIAACNRYYTDPYLHVQYKPRHREAKVPRWGVHSKPLPGPPALASSVSAHGSSVPMRIGAFLIYAMNMQLCTGSNTKGRAQGLNEASGKALA